MSEYQYNVLDDKTIINDSDSKPNVKSLFGIIDLAPSIDKRNIVTYFFAVFIVIGSYVFINANSGYLLTNFLHIPKENQGKNRVLFHLFQYLNFWIRRVQWFLGFL